MLQRMYNREDNERMPGILNMHAKVALARGYFEYAYKVCDESMEMTRRLLGENVDDEDIALALQVQA